MSCVNYISIKLERGKLEEYFLNTNYKNAYKLSPKKPVSMGHDPLNDPLRSLLP